MSKPEPADQSPSRDLLVPVLDLSQGAPDSVVLGTWHMALSNLASAEIPHQLFGLWVFPERGGAILLGPEALAQDNLAIPGPDPHLAQDQLFELEETLRRARYASAVAVPVRTAVRDVGLLLLGTFEGGAYGPSAARAMVRLAEQLAAPFQALGTVLIGDGVASASSSEGSVASLVADLANAAPSGPELVRRLSGLLHPRVPHDRFDVILFANRERTALPLSGLSGRRRWGAGSSTWTDLAKLLDEMLGPEPSVSIANLPADAPGLGWPGGGAPGVGPTRIASVVAARLTLGGESAGLVVAGHVSPGLYRPADEEVLREAAAAVAGRVMSFRLESEAQVLRGQLEVLGAPTLPVLRAAEALAGTAHLGEALSRFEREVRDVIGETRISYLLRVGELDIVEISAETIRPLADLVPVAIELSDARGIMEEGRTWSHEFREAGERLVIALRVADRTIGAMVVDAPRFESARESAAAAQQFAAILAPHLELLRRTTSVRPAVPAVRRT